MFEFHFSPDGHFGLIGSVEREEGAAGGDVVRCPTCRATYRLLDRVNEMGQVVERK